MCDDGRKYSEELKNILFSDMTEEEKEEWIKYETTKEGIVDFWDAHPEIGTPMSDLGLKPEDFENAPAYEVTDKDIKMEYTKEEFATLATPVYRYESYVYGKRGYGKNSRRFCREVARRTENSVLTYRQILALNGSNPGFGSGGSNIYSVFLYRGGSNCKHFWVKYYIDQNGGGLVKSPTNEQPTQIHKGDMPPPKK